MVCGDGETGRNSSVSEGQWPGDDDITRVTGATVDGAFLRELRFKSGRVRLVRNGDGEIYSLRRRSWMQCPLGTAMQVFISTKRNQRESQKGWSGKQGKKKINRQHGGIRKGFQEESQRSQMYPKVEDDKARSYVSLTRRGSPAGMPRTVQVGTDAQCPIRITSSGTFRSDNWSPYSSE